MLKISSTGILVSELTERPWERMCFYPQFSYPEQLNGEESYSSCEIWRDVEERNILIVLSGSGPCVAFGVVGDFLGPDFDEHRCFSRDEIHHAKLVDRSGVIGLED